MNKILIVTVLCATCLINPPKANAINEEWSAVAGFVGGVLAANAFDNHSHRTVTVNHYDNYYQRTEYYRPSGRYEWRSTRVYIPGRWVYEYTPCGRRERIWQPGYYTYERERVWVSGYSRCD